MIKSIRKKLNNEGSTFLLVMVAIIFIGLLASLILALSASSYRMKVVDYQSRQTFYNSEEISGKIYSQLGMDALGILGESYVKITSQLNAGGITGQSELNKSVRNEYYKGMMLYFKLLKKDMATDPNGILLKTDLAKPELKFSPKSADADEVAKVTYVETMLSNMANDILVDNTGAEISMADRDVTLKVQGDIVCKPEGGKYSDGSVYPTITINDVYISYVDKNTNYQSDYTFDIVVKYPEWNFAYSNPTSKQSDVDSFLDYVLIANGSINFNPGTGVTNVNGCVASGNNSVSSADENNLDNGIFVNYGTVNFNGNASNWYEQNAVVTTDNIIIRSSAAADASASLSGAKVWCNSIMLRRDATRTPSDNHSSLSATNSNLYLQDDLQLDGLGSVVSINGGSYYGYGTNTTDGGIAQDTSSSIIVNGNNSRLTLANMAGIYIYGLSYVDIAGNSYRTGESLSVKSNQEIYLVPDYYMPGANPSKTPIDVTLLKNNLSGATAGKPEFFGWQWLDHTNPIIVRTYTYNGVGYYFYYMNFASPYSQSHYVNAVISDTKLANATQEDIRSDIYDRVKENLSDFSNDGTDYVLNYSMAGGANAISAGAMILARGGVTKNSDTIVNKTNQTGTLVNTVDTAAKLRKRYRLMKSLLLDITDTELLDDYQAVLCTDLAVTAVGKRALDPVKYNKDNRDISNLELNRSMVNNFANLSKLAAYAGSTGFSRTHSMGTLQYVYLAGSGSYTVGNFTGLLVVDGDVIVNGDINGLIIATGKITVQGSHTLTSNPQLVDSLMKEEQTPDSAKNNNDPKADVLYFYPLTVNSSVKNKAIDTLNYADVLYYDNWRKYKDN